jgi:uncharacterized protein YfaP (DUF2135 family)
MLFALMALLGLTVVVGAGNAIASSSGDTVAVAAKKKCKKGKKSAVAAKKKKCKKKKTAVPAPATPPSPTVRATLTWNDASDLDLIVWAPDGTHAFVFSDPNPIANSQFSADDLDGLGPETFTDLTTPNRQFSYGVCAFSGSSGSTVATIQYKRADGSTGSVTSTAGDLNGDGDLVYVHVAGGFDPGTQPNPCLVV